MALRGLIVGLFALLAPGGSLAGETRPRSILVLDQSDMRGSFYHQIFAAFQTEVGSHPPSHLMVYAEDLDLEHFGGEDYEVALQQMLRAKYRDKPVGVLVAIGEAALQLVLRWRDELWPGIPVVFTIVDEAGFRRLKLPSDVTGNIVDAYLTSSLNQTRAALPAPARSHMH